MKTISKLSRILKKIAIALAFIWATSMEAQPSIFVLPVQSDNFGSSAMNENQLSLFTDVLTMFFVQELESLGNVRPLKREHILLLLKELPELNPDELSDEAYKQISKLEKIRYFLKCSIESIEFTDKNIVAPVKLIIIDGKDVSILWEKNLLINKPKPGEVLSEHLLLNEIFNPSFSQAIKEMKKIKY